MTSGYNLSVAIDFDDVVVDFVGGVVDAVNRDFGANLRLDDVITWNMNPVFDPVVGRDWWDWLRDHSWLWAEKFRPIPGALGGIERLRLDGFFVECLTSKPPWGESVVWAWLAKYMKGPHGFQRVTVIPNAREKSNHGKSLWSNADILVDDRGSNIDEWTMSGGQWGVLFDRPWNKDHVLGDGQIRALDWDEVLSAVDLVAQNQSVPSASWGLPPRG